MAGAASSVARYSKVEAQDQGYDELQSPTLCSNPRFPARHTTLYHLLLALTYTSIGFGLCALLWRPRSSPTAMPSPIPSRVREVSIEKIWMPDEAFNPPGGRTAESDKVWDERHKRYVVIENPGRYGLNPSADASNTTAPGTQIYSVSSFHQFHCLRLLRYSWYEALERGAGVLEDASGIPNSPPVKLLGPHIDHCFDFLRQALECHADPALEPFMEADGSPLLHGSSGWRTKHMCRDYDALLSWVNERNIPSFEADFETPTII